MKTIDQIAGLLVFSIAVWLFSTASVFESANHQLSQLFSSLHASLDFTGMNDASGHIVSLFQSAHDSLLNNSEKMLG